MRARDHACGLVALALTGCGHSGYPCTSSTQCLDRGTQGVCEPAGFCAFPDPMCPSGERFEPSAGDGLGGTCVEVCGTVGTSCCTSGSACTDNTFCNAGSCEQCVVDIGVGQHHTCALKYDGTVWCSGANDLGQLGTSALGGPPSSTRIQARDQAGVIRDATAIAAGAGHTCVLRAGGAVWCWGRNDDGQIGDNKITNASAAVPATRASDGAGVTGMSKLVAGHDETCALDASGTPWCWGENLNGTLGDGTIVNRGQAAPVLTSVGGPVFTNVEQFTIGRNQACARTAAGEIWCWGQNDHGQVGDNTIVDKTLPVHILDGTAVAAGRLHTCAIRLDSSVWCWGQGSHGRLGTGPATGDALSPVATLADATGRAFTGAAEVAAAGVSCAITTDRDASCWGTNPHGQTGTGVGTYFPMPMIREDGTPLHGVTRIVANYALTCAFLEDGELLCAGRNNEGQLGDGTFSSRNFPTPIQVSCP